MSCPPTLHWRQALGAFMAHSAGYFAIRYVEGNRVRHWRGEVLGIPAKGPLVRCPDGQPRVLCSWDAVRYARPYGAVVVRGGRS